MNRVVAPLVLILALLMVAAFAPNRAQAQTPAQTPQVTAELDADETMVGQPLVLRIKILVPTWLPKPPVFPTIEMPSLMVRLPERASGPVSERIDGETWSGVQRAYRLYPLTSGVYTLPQSEVTLTYAEAGKPDPRTYTAPLPQIRFTATVPEAARDLQPLIIAEGFALDQSIEGGTDMAAGDAVTRSVTASISGTTPVMIPQLVSDMADPALRAYPKEPVVSDSEDRGVLSGSRQEVITYVGQQSGQPALPPIEIRWFNLKSGAVETAALPGLDLTVTGAVPVAAPMQPAEIAALVLQIGLVLVAVWVLWRFFTPRVAAWVEAWRKSERFAHRQVLAALRARDLARVNTALVHWSRFHPDARHGDGLDTALNAALARIGAARYGAPGGRETDHDWRVATATYQSPRRSMSHGHATGKTRSKLPPLNP